MVGIKFSLIADCNTVKALVSGHAQGVKKVSITGAGCLPECENTDFVWEF